VTTEEFLGSLRGTPIGPVASFDGTKLYVGAAGEGLTVVFAHGFCLNATSWHFQIKELADEFRVVVYDMRGHGLSERPASDDWSMEALSRDLASVIDAVGEEPVIVVGHSMGGMALLQYCELFPDSIGSRVAGVVLVDTCARDVIGGMVPSAARIAMPALRLLERAATLAASRSPAAFDRIREARSDLVELLVRLMGFGPSAPADQVAFMHSMLASVPAEVLVPVVQTLRTMDVSHALDSVDVPALVIVGSRDRLTPRAAARLLATNIHGAELVVVPQSGHMPMLEHPGPFNEIIRPFLRHPGAAYGGRRIHVDRSPEKT
jgi:pimeloyl-ACP methyl ester carboxylesterase